MRFEFPSNVSIIRVNAPNYWASLSLIQPILRKSLEKFFGQLKDYDILGLSEPPVESDLWIVPIGYSNPILLSWFKRKYPNPYKRPRTLFFLGGEGAKLCYHLYLYRDIFRVDDEWIVSSFPEKNLIDEFVPGNNRTSVLFYPVAELFRKVESKKQKESLRQELGLPLDKEILLYAGRISAQKNVLTLFDVLEKHPELNLLVCGDIDNFGVPHFPNVKQENLHAVMAYEIQKRKLSDRIIFKSYLSQELLAKVMQASDYQISLSAHYGEDFGYSIAQGLCSGLKTILSHWGGHQNWKRYFSETELKYTQLDWKDQVQGKPVLDSASILPTESSLDFRKAYENDFERGLQQIVYEAEGQTRRPRLDFDGMISDYWEEHLKESKKWMFTSPDDELFKKVLLRYST